MNVVATGIILFGLSRREVWELTLAEYAACSKVVDEERRALDYQLGWIRALIMEPYRDKQKHPAMFQADDFSMYSSKDKQQSNVGREMTPDEQLAYVRTSVIPFFDAQKKARERELKGE